MWLHSLKVVQLLRSAACLHTNQSRSYLNHLVFSLLIKTDATYVYDRHESDLSEIASYATTTESDVSEKKVYATTNNKSDPSEITSCYVKYRKRPVRNNK